MRELMYDHNSALIVLVLFLVLLIAVEVGYRLGMRRTATATDAIRTQINTIQASLLGVLALLLGFTFSLSLQRYDTRSQAVVEEANAIGTAILRAELLPPGVRADARETLREYLDQRVSAGRISLDRDQERRGVLLESNRLLDALWQSAAQAAEENPNPVTTGLYVQALNDVIDSYSARDAALNRHVPEVVLLLLFAAFTLTACLVGYASGFSGQRSSFSTYVLILLIVFLVFLIIDLDRPRRGLIAVSQQSLIDLQTSVGAPAAQ